VTEVKIAFRVPQYLDESRGVYIMRVMHLKSEIAQRELNDLGVEITPVVSPRSVRTILPND